MNTLSLKPVLFAGLLTGILFSSFVSATSSIIPWEIRDPALPYIAMVRDDPQFGSAVIYNPTLCEQIGDACAFFRAHEYAHSFLNDLMLPPKSYPKSLENRADCWAAKNLQPHEVLATYQFLTNLEAHKDLPVFGNPVERAQIVRECAMEKGNWPENVSQEN